ncbi:MAG: PilZ domain-containing protein [Vicinamibacterales bacterium]
MSTNHSPRRTRPPVTEERRLAPRIVPADVPWLTAIKPNITGTATLVNISKTGVLIDTRDRLSPGRRTTLVAAMDDQKTEKLPAVVVRTYVVSITSSGLLYRTALEFDQELPWELASPETSEAALGEVLLPENLRDAPVASTEEVMLAGPVDALFTTDSTSQLVSVTNLTETGCIVRTNEAVKPGGWVSVAVLFSDANRPMLTGRVSEVAGDGRCMVKFHNVAPTERAALKTELRRQSQRQGRTVGGEPKGGGQLAAGDATMGLKVSGQLYTVHSAQW